MSPSKTIAEKWRRGLKAPFENFQRTCYQRKIRNCHRSAFATFSNFRGGFYWKNSFDISLGYCTNKELKEFEVAIGRRKYGLGKAKLFYARCKCGFPHNSLYEYYPALTPTFMKI